MATLGNYGRGLVLAMSLSALVGAACATNLASVNGACVVEPSAGHPCDVPVDGGMSDIGLVGYSCTGSARPDDDGTYVQGVPGGVLCANRGAPGDGGAQEYCCTPYTTPCVPDPLNACGTADYGYQCLGSIRPESFNPAITCGNGVYEGDLIDYCCSGTPQAAGCLQSDSAEQPDGGPCPPQLLGWTCSGENLPKAEELGESQSRADVYYLLCPTPTPAENPLYSYYCCYVPAVPPIGASCVEDTAVPGCQPSRFGFACYGPDTPPDDYPPMHCPEPGFPGRSAEGYPATLYCCDFE
jgi:hypothetical protein